MHFQAEPLRGVLKDNEQLLSSDIERHCLSIRSDLRRFAQSDSAARAVRLGLTERRGPLSTGALDGQLSGRLRDFSDEALTELVCLGLIVQRSSKKPRRTTAERGFCVGRNARDRRWSPDRIHISSSDNDLDGGKLKRTPKKTPDGVSLPLACHERSLHA